MKLQLESPISMKNRVRCIWDIAAAVSGLGNVGGVGGVGVNGLELVALGQSKLQKLGQLLHTTSGPVYRIISSISKYFSERRIYLFKI